MDNEKIIIIAVLAGTFITFSLIMTIIVFVVLYQRKMVERENTYQLYIKNKEVELLQSVINTQESERNKIAMNLHDEINPLLSALKLTITKRERDILKKGFEFEGMELEKKLVDDIVHNVNNVTRDLSPQILNRYGISKALNSFADSIDGVKVNFYFSDEQQIVLEDQIALNVYRITLELVHNILKHEKTSEINIHLDLKIEKLKLVVSHDGQGISNQNFINLSETTTGIGLNSIKTRTVLLKGVLDYHNINKASITLTIPLNNEIKN